MLTMLLVAFTAPFATGLVLCICHDGHVSLENACNPALCCPPADCNEAMPGGANLGAVPSAHACLDLLLESPASPARSAREDCGLQQGQPEVRALPVICRVAPLTAAPAPPATGRADAVPDSLILARTVVLTI